MIGIVRKLIGSRNDRLLKSYEKIVNKINELEPIIEKFTDEELKNKSLELKEKVKSGVTTLNDALVDAFALCREASKRVLGMRHFDVQLIGGVVLHEGKIAEMKTGEGKTLVATLAVYLNALAGKGVHVVTVNDYLSARDATYMGKLYNFLGLSVGINLSNIEHYQKQDAYKSDITYGTNNEFGFDYLRDNMEQDPNNKVQRELFFAVVDEVDSILIDEARTPLIISGQSDDNIDLYKTINEIPSLLKKQTTEDSQDGDYWVDEKHNQIILSETGHEHLEKILTKLNLLPKGQSLYSASNIILMHHLIAALKAYNLFNKNQHYVVHNDEIIIVDEFTGRLMPGRRWSDGLHQAIEAKEGVSIKKENQTLASITFQNYFRLYQKLSGMTGTADTEAYEFQDIYGLETVVIPTNRPMIRKDFNDQVFRTIEEKYEAILEDIKKRHLQKQPILIGTTSIENSELVSKLLKKSGLNHNVLNAKEHEKESYIIAQAGKPGMITVATNMAGRGTDIVLGGNILANIKLIENDNNLSDLQKDVKINDLKLNWEKDHDFVVKVGGLHIVGTERHESRRIDNQLRGRAGRQGDPGSSRFFLSFEDPLLRLFALDKAAFLLNKLAPERGVAIEAGILTRQIESAQRKVEARNFDIRKQLLEYDNVANDQRKVIYHLRNEILTGNDIDLIVKEIFEEVIYKIVDDFIPNDVIEEQWDKLGLETILSKEFNINNVKIDEFIKEDNLLDNEKIKQKLIKIVEDDYLNKQNLVGQDNMRQFERKVMLNVIDLQWKDHLSLMEYLRQGIHFRGYAQKDPKQEYKRESFELFQELLTNINNDIAKYLISVTIEDSSNKDLQYIQKIN